jgi:hypothetical protein
MFCTEQFAGAVERLSLSPGDTLFIVTDGVSEPEDAEGVEYGTARHSAFVHARQALTARDLVHACGKDLAAHRGGSQPAADVTLLARRRGWQRDRGLNRVPAIRRPDSICDSQRSDLALHGGPGGAAQRRGVSGQAGEVVR